jgi:hypothetical protein
LVECILNIKCAQVLHGLFCVSPPYCNQSWYTIFDKESFTFLMFTEVCFRG